MVVIISLVILKMTIVDFVNLIFDGDGKCVDKINGASGCDDGINSADKFDVGINCTDDLDYKINAVNESDGEGINPECDGESDDYNYIPGLHSSPPLILPSDSPAPLLLV